MSSTSFMLHYLFISELSLTNADVRLARRIRPDTVEKGRDIGQVLDQYPKFVKSAFDDFILPTKKYVPMEEIIMLQLI
ncbi:hypothetical protein MKX03_014353 [Papaver bracteatum]|nr:hypothetical protein MKX03_014353 [Papaver bracteatum]